MDAILTFHSIDDQGSVLSFRPSDLEALLAGLREDGVALVTLDDLWSSSGRGGHRVVLTFDDSLQSVLEQALPLLERYRAPALLYAVPGFLGRDNGWPGQVAGIPRLPLMTEAGLKEWCAAGQEVGGHTCHHVRLVGRSTAECREEIRVGRDRLEQSLGRPVEHFAYPYGSYDAQVRAVTGEYHRTAVTTRMGFLKDEEDPLALPRLDAYYLQGRFSRGSPFRLTTRGWLAARMLLRRLRGSGSAA